MYNYINEFSSLFGAFSIIAIFFLFVFLIFYLAAYIFGALGVMEVAKKNNIPNPWLAFIPVANSYLIGQLGFEVYSNENEKNTTFPWIMAGLSASGIILNGDSSLYTLAEIALAVFGTISYYRIYKYLTPKYKMYTVLSFFFGGIPLFMNKDMIKAKKETNEKEASVISEGKIKETKEEIKENIERPLYCSNCGNKLNKTAKFCSNCGKKIG